MIWYYLVVAFRNVARNKGFALLNIFGFSIGLSAFLLIIVFVIDELSYDKFNIHHDRIFRVDTELKYGGSTTSFAIAAPPVAEAMLHDLPEVKHAVRIESAQNIQFKKGTEIIQEDRTMYADQSLFDVFTFDVIDGSTAQALAGFGAIVITKRIALKYFGTTKVAGKTLTIANDNSIHTIKAVVDNMPAQSHFHADVFLPLSSQANSRITNFTQFNFNTYVLLNGNADAALLKSKLQGFLKKHLTEDMNVEAFEKGGNHIKLVLMPLTDIHLYSNKQRELEANADIAYVYIFSAAATLILVLACINFINLFTAKAANRAQEIGVRKTLGSARHNIMIQFLTETFVMTSISVLMAVVLALAALPAFGTITGKTFELDSTTLLMMIPITVIAIVVVTILAGFYPAFYLSSFQPIKVLKGELSSAFRGTKLRTILVVIQFTIATFLVVNILVILDQLEFIQSKNVGYNREQVLIVKNVSSLNDAVVMKQEVKQISGVINASLSAYLPTGGARWPNSISSENEKGLLVEFWTIDADYINTLEMDILQGRNFLPTIPGDSSAIILNESAAKLLKLDTDLMEKRIEAAGKTYTVIGIVKDFNFNSLRKNITPLVMTLGYDWRSSLIVRTAAGQLPNVLTQIRARWEKLNPDQHFEFSFMDEDFAAIYATEQKVKKLFTIFTVLAVTIASVGIFGLSAYTAEQRTRELSIRKLFGASITNVFNLMTYDFIRAIIISIIIALPSAWLTMNWWLDGFAYRTNISMLQLFISAMLVVIVAIITVSYQTLKAAMKNPLDNLRAE